MGLSPKEKPNNETKNQPMQIMQQNHHLPVARGCSRICSHQQVDDHRKREYHTAEHTIIKVG